MSQSAKAMSMIALSHVTVGKHALMCTNPTRWTNKQAASTRGEHWCPVLSHNVMVPHPHTHIVK